MLGWAGTYDRLQHNLASVTKPSDAARIVELYKDQDPTITELATDLTKPSKKDQQVALERLKDYVATRATAEGYGSDTKALTQAIEIKRSPLYRDDRTATSNWLDKAFENLINMLKKNFQRSDTPKVDPNLGLLAGGFGTAVAYLVVFILGGLVCYFAYVVGRHVRWRMKLKRKSKAVLEEDEPERTLDEWLERADALEREGNFRDAVRCLYLACLLRFDEARIARFDRGQTNWEHLRRIQSSPALPSDLDFQSTTQAFDQIWYGMRTRGKPDVEMFRERYLEITGKLMPKAA